jgi:hypothetical protein
MPLCKLSLGAASRQCVVCEEELLNHTPAVGADGAAARGQDAPPSLVLHDEREQAAGSCIHAILAGGTPPRMRRARQLRQLRALT